MNKKSYISILTLICILATVAPSATIAASQEGPRYGGTMIMLRNTDSSILNPLLTIDDPSFLVGNQIFSGLMYRGIDETTGALTYEPDLAESWETSEDGLSITFHLRDNVLWHDGVPFTAADVKYTFETLYQDESLALPQRGFFEPIDYVEIVDDNTAVFHMEYVSPIIFPLGFAFWRDKEVVPKHIFENIADFWNNDFNENPTVGTGPFKFVEWKKGDQIVLERNENYYMKDKDGNQLPYVDKLIYKVAPNTASMIAALEAGEAATVDIVPETEAARLMENEDLDVFEIFGGIGLLLYMGMNQGTSDAGNENPILQDKTVRHALLHGLNRQEIIDLALGGFGKVQTSWVSSKLVDFYEPNVPKYEYNPELANQMLDDAGYDKGEDGFRFTLRILHTAGSLNEQRLAEVCKAQWAEIGVNIDIVSADGPTEQSWAKEQYDFDFWVFGHASGPDPDRLFVYYHGSQISPGNWNYIRYNNPEVNAIWDESRITVDPEARQDMFKQLQMIIMEDLPIIPLQERVLFSAKRSDWHGIDTTGAYWYCNHFERVWWDGGEPIAPEVAEFVIHPGVVFVALVIASITMPLIKKK